jgi:glycosyltransferase involved in cell wall biosynthesis
MRHPRNGPGSGRSRPGFSWARGPEASLDPSRTNHSGGGRMNGYDAMPDETPPSTSTRRRLVIVVRADPVICGHSGEARNLAETALTRGFTEVRILTWPMDLLNASGLPLKPLDGVQPYSEGIEVERPAAVGDYRVPDGRYLAGITGRLVELFTDGVPTVAMSLYLSPHTIVVSDAVRVARSTGLPVNVTTIAEAVGSDVTNVVRSCVADGRFGAAAQALSAYLDSDVPVAVSDYTRQLIISSAQEIDDRHGTSFAARCRDRIEISYPAINTADYLELDPVETAETLAARGLTADGYVLFLSRLARAKGVDDLIAGFAASHACQDLTLVVAGSGPQAAELHALAAQSPAADRIVFLDDVDDDEKPHLMAGCAAFALPSKPRPEFVETFGIALVEKMLAGGGPVITTDTGGIGEAVGHTALVVPVDSPSSITAALDLAVTLPDHERATMAAAAREHALQFDRARVFDALMARLEPSGDLALASL